MVQLIMFVKLVLIPGKKKSSDTELVNKKIKIKHWKHLVTINRIYNK